MFWSYITALNRLGVDLAVLPTRKLKLNLSSTCPHQVNLKRVLLF